jgi:DNA-binding NtrC family response regulator
MLEDRTLLRDKMIKGRSVFIVDNDTRMVDHLKDILENEGFGVVVAFCGEAAIAKLRKESCHCAVLDYSLPDVKGDELAKSFRIEVPDMGIILLTGFKSSIDPVKLEAFDYVFEKPVNLEALIAAVKQITS